MSLSNLKVFIGGPIQFAIRDNGFHELLKETIEKAAAAVREMNGQVFSAHAAERFGLDTPVFTPEQVSQRDFAWMQECDVFIPILPVLSGQDLLRTDGTHIELGWASALRRPIVLVTQLPIVANASHLLKGLEQICCVRKLDINDLRANPWQLPEIVESLLEERSQLETA